MEETEREHYVEISREFISIETHDECGGIIFNFRVKQLDLYTLLGEEEIQEIRKSVAEGIHSLEGLLTFEEVELEEFFYSKCEKCGEEWFYPVSGGL